jgi:hypothetical protein
MAEQIDKGALRKHIRMKDKRYLKREQTRKLRRQRKDVDRENPQHNRYGGWAV